MSVLYFLTLACHPKLFGTKSVKSEELNILITNENRLNKDPTTLYELRGASYAFC